MGFVGNYIFNLASVAVGRQPTRPLLFSYYVTHRCDLDCRYCSDGAGRPFSETPVDELPLPDVRRLLTILRRETDTLDVTGGEPLARRDLEDILASARRAGLRTVLNTKGIGLPDRADLLKHVDVLVLSVDSLDSSRLAGIIGRSEGVATRIIRTLEWALESRGRGGFALFVAAVATPDNLDDVGDVLKLAVRCSVGFQISPQVVGLTVHPRLRNNDRYRELISQVLAAKRNGARVLGVPGYLRGIRDFAEFRCHPLLMPTIRPDGRMYYPCLEAGGPGISLPAAGSYRKAVMAAEERYGRLPDCRGRCHIFCHMALSMLQRRPLSAAGELRSYRSCRC